jgi:tellurite resistance protein TehA-like permease
MGTGIVAVLFKSIPFEHQVFQYAAITFFILNTILFTLATLVSIARYTIWPQIAVVMIQDPNNSLFVACFSMSLATLINSWMLICVPIWGEWARTVALAAWIFDTLIAVATTLILPMMLMSRDDIKSLDRITAAQLLPIASTVVAAGIGSRLANLVDDPQIALGIILTCYVLFGMSTFFAMMILTLYYHRLVLHKLPAREVIVSAFLPLGPCGYSAQM